MDLYSDIILDLFKNPKNKGKLKDYDHEAEGRNLSCGDEVKLYLKFANDKIEDISFEGYGCVISQVTTDLLCSIVKGKTYEEIIEIINNATNMVKGKNFDEEKIGDLILFENVKNYPARVKCFSLSLRTLEDILKNIKKEV